MKSSVLKSAFLYVPAYALVALSLLTFTGCNSGAGDGFSHKEVSIDLVNPPCAQPGAVSGYIEGNGFGAENVSITVGGIEAEVLGATGHDASFVVPEGIAPGPIQVVVTNPGGRIATISWITCCIPEPEVCDGIDNDCNELIDDGIADIVSGSDVGECQPQIEVCIDGTFVISQFAVGPIPESCDSLDNDCNGIVDDAPVCEPTCVPTGVEVCDGIDNDCNGATDDGIADIVSGSDEGECQSEIQRCEGGAFTVVQMAIDPSPEVCDGLDNDCTGDVDDHPECAVGVLLEGPADAIAAEHIVDVSAAAPIGDEDLTEDESGRTVYLSRLQIRIAQDATVGAVNGLLMSHDALIVGALEGARVIVIDFPPVESVQAIEDKASDLEADPAVAWALVIVEPEPNSLPTNYSAPLSFFYRGFVDSLLAVRAPAAWNAKAAMQPAEKRPVVVVWDYFNRGQLNSTRFSVKVGPKDLNFLPGVPSDDHGYHVLGIIGGTHGGDLTLAGLVTGMFPGTSSDGLIGSLVDGHRGPKKVGWGVLTTNTAALLQAIANTKRNVILNTSFGMRCPRAKTMPILQCNQDDLDAVKKSTLREAADWIELIRAAKLENRVLHFKSAGNDSVQSSTADHMNAAALSSELKDETGKTVSKLTNTFVIENRTNTTTEPIEVGALRASSNKGGNLAAIGTSVHSMLDGFLHAGSLSGTSMAAPQAAGLAAYLWSLDSKPTVQQLKLLITKTADDKKTIDAYAAVLALDSPPWAPNSNFSGAKIRKAILDTNGDKKFNIVDLKKYLSEFKDRAGTKFDYSRWDLNGDGRTGGGTPGSFNLDLEDPKKLGELDDKGENCVSLAPCPTQTIEGESKKFEEREATDEAILCYYAYSPLYDATGEAGGDGCERYEAASDVCFCGATTDAPEGCPVSATGSLIPEGDEPLTVTQALVPLGVCPVLGQIVFQSLRDGNSEIYVMYENGSNQVNLTNNPASDTTPTWLPRRTILGEPEDTEIPGGTMIGFSSNRDGERDIYVMDAVVTDPEIPPENTTDTNLSEESWPAWSPDGTQTTFDLVNGLGRDIWVMDFVTDPDGSNPQGLNRTNLSNDPDSGNTISSWKPDGTKIAFAALRDTDFEIYVINSDGSELTNLTNNSASDNAPSWSPDGTRIAFWSDRGSNRDIYVMNADGSGLARLTDDPGRDTSPTWSPDGKKIAFRSQRDGDSEIYVMDFVTDSDGFNPRGENLKNLTENSASDTNPRWSPLP